MQGLPFQEVAARTTPSTPLKPKRKSHRSSPGVVDCALSNAGQRSAIRRNRCIFIASEWVDDTHAPKGVNGCRKAANNLHFLHRAFAWQGQCFGCFPL